MRRVDPDHHADVADIAGSDGIHTAADQFSAARDKIDFLAAVRGIGLNVFAVREDLKDRGTFFRVQILRDPVLRRTVDDSEQERDTRADRRQDRRGADQRGSFAFLLGLRGCLLRPFVVKKYVEGRHVFVRFRKIKRGQDTRRRSGFGLFRSGRGLGRRRSLILFLRDLRRIFGPVLRPGSFGAVRYILLSVCRLRFSKPIRLGVRLVLPSRGFILRRRGVFLVKRLFFRGFCRNAFVGGLVLRVLLLLPFTPCCGIIVFVFENAGQPSEGAALRFFFNGFVENLRQIDGILAGGLLLEHFREQIVRPLRSRFLFGLGLPGFFFHVRGFSDLLKKLVAVLR